jgi:hypothetical protein
MAAVERDGFATIYLQNRRLNLPHKHSHVINSAPADHQALGVVSGFSGNFKGLAL